MKAPRFWHDAPGLRSALLAPLAWLYARATARRLAGGTGYRAAVPVVCIGNINAGGTGKTPMVIALAERLAGRCRVVVVSKGYGGRLEGPVEVDPARHRAEDVGDEPLLLAAFASVVVARSRIAGARLAEEIGAGLILLDDGHQDPALARDATILTVGGVARFGNGRVIPAGPLREPVATGLARADALVVTSGGADVDAFARDIAARGDLPVVTGRLEPLETGMRWEGLRVLAFAGIGHPEKFFATLRGMGAEVVRSVPLGDHQPLTETLMQRLVAEAKARHLQLVCTEKDAVRLPEAMRGQVLALPVRLRLDDWGPVDAILERVLT